MTDECRPTQGSGQSKIYQIILEGHIGKQWSKWFEGFSITLHPRGQTILVGPVIDQSALHGVLKKIRDLGMPLISVNRLDPGEESSGLSRMKI